MSFGVRTYAASGLITLDIVDRLTRIAGIYTVTANWWYYDQGDDMHYYQASIYVPGLRNDGTWFVSRPEPAHIGYVTFVTNDNLTIHFAKYDPSGNTARPPFTFTIDVMRC